MEDREAAPCKFCGSALARYTCPRCNTVYCSVKCYKDARHRGCSEDFYRDWVHTYLRTEQARPEARQRMVEALKAAQAEEIDDQPEGQEEEDVDEVAQLVRELDKTHVDVETAWKYLTDAERREFEDLIESGDAGKLVPLWKPWWEEATLVTEVTPDSEVSRPVVRPLRELTSRPPNPCVVNGVLNVLCGYVHVVRLYNGEMVVPQSAEDLIQTSVVLAEDVVFATPAEAVQSVVQKVVLSGGSGTKTSPSTVEDLPSVLDVSRRSSTSSWTVEDLPSLLDVFGRFLRRPGLRENVLRALEETRRVMEEAGKTCARGRERDLKRRLRGAVRKVEYMKSWTAEHVEELRSSAAEVDVEAAAVIADVEGFEEARRRVGERRKTAEPRALIEELD